MEPPTPELGIFSANMTPQGVVQTTPIGHRVFKNLKKMTKSGKK